MADLFSTVTIDEVKYELQYNFNDLVDAEERIGCNLLDAVERLLGHGDMNATQLRGLLFAMITPYRGFPSDPPAQLKACGQLIRVDTMGPIMRALGEACALAVSEEYGNQYREAMEKAQTEVPGGEITLKEDPEKAALREAAAAVLG